MSVFALGIELDGEGSHPAAWRRANHPPSESLSGRTLTQKVRAAENRPAGEVSSGTSCAKCSNRTP